VLLCRGDTHVERLDSLLHELGRRKLTNVLVEGGGRVLGSFFDARHIDEAHVFVAPKLIGGSQAAGPLAGNGISKMTEALSIDAPKIEQIGDDVYVHGRIRK
jgi:diaminohydroxyphosphoribosylaminopyrimidine deaminase / 5-amino-6-(5-phosphoribosylamino)uracil reductase